MHEIKELPCEQISYSFEDMAELETYGGSIAATGNRHFNEVGNETAIAIIKGEYEDADTGYAYETFDELAKITGKRWSMKTIKGYSQSEWQRLYYAVDDIDSGYITEFETWYFGKIREFIVTEPDGEYPDWNLIMYVPDFVFMQGKDAIVEYLDLDDGSECKVLVMTGKYTKVYEYAEME